MPRYKAELSSQDPKQIEQALDAVACIVRCIPEIDDLSVHVSVEEEEPKSERSPFEIDMQWRTGR